MWVKSILFCKKITFVIRFLPYDVLATWQIVISYIREVEKVPELWEIQEVHLVFPGSLANPIFQFLHSSLKIVYLIKTIFVPRYTRPSFSGYFNICTSLKGHLMCYWYASLSLSLFSIIYMYLPGALKTSLASEVIPSWCLKKKNSLRKCFLFVVYLTLSPVINTPTSLGRSYKPWQ